MASEGGGNPGTLYGSHGPEDDILVEYPGFYQEMSGDYKDRRGQWSLVDSVHQRRSCRYVVHGGTCGGFLPTADPDEESGASGAAKPSLMPEYSLRESIFGSAQTAKSGAQINGIAAASANCRW
eukprot:2954997-Pyramimonas_sp.AAC.1